MPQTLDAALKAAQLVTDDRLYRLIQLPRTAIMPAAGVISAFGEAFCAVIVDMHEVTLILPSDALPDFERRLPTRTVSETEYRLITFDAVLEPTLVGFMARVSAALAAAGIPIFPFAAYSRDHILVPAAQFEAAMDALRNLQGGA